MPNYRESPRCWVIHKAPAASRRHFSTVPCCWRCPRRPQSSSTQPDLHPPEKPHDAILTFKSFHSIRFARRKLIRIDEPWQRQQPTAPQLQCLLLPDHDDTQDSIIIQIHRNAWLLSVPMLTIDSNLNNSGFLVEFCLLDQKPGLFRFLLCNLLLLDSLCEFPEK